MEYPCQGFSFHNNDVEVFESAQKAVKRMLSGNLAPVVFCGSLISVFSPTSIPNGKTMTDTMYNFLFGSIACQNFSYDNAIEMLAEKIDVDIVRDIFFGKDGFGSGVGFEMLFENCGQVNKAKAMLADFFANRKYNPLHSLLAEKLHEGEISAIITPNYDDCLDRAAFSRGFDKYKPIFSKNDFLKENKNCCFYIHGSIAGGNPNDLICTMSDEHIMLDWKKDLVTRLVRNRYIIMFGYSGLDFEICPVLTELVKNGTCPGIIYNDWKYSGLHNIKTLLDQEYKGSNPNVIVEGDIGDFLHLIFRKRLSLEFAPDSDGFTRAVKETFTDQLENDFWKLRLLHSMGCVGVGLRVSKQISQKYDLTPSQTKRLYMLNAALHYTSGTYKTAALYFKKSKSAKEHKGSFTDSLNETIAVRLHRFECFKTGKFIIRSAIEFIFMRLETLILKIFSHRKDKIEDAVFLYRFLMLLTDIVKTFPMASHLIMPLMSKTYKRGVEISVKCGERRLMQNFALARTSLETLIDRGRINKCFDIVDEDIDFSIKDGISGYRELGTYFEQAIYARRKIMAKENLSLFKRNPILAHDSPQHHELKTLVVNSWRCGIIPEAWKSLFLLGQSELTVNNDKLILSDLFNRCQYSVFFTRRAIRYMKRFNSQAL